MHTCNFLRVATTHLLPCPRLILLYRPWNFQCSHWGFGLCFSTGYCSMALCVRKSFVSCGKILLMLRRSLVFSIQIINFFKSLYSWANVGSPVPLPLSKMINLYHAVTCWHSLPSVVISNEQFSWSIKCMCYWQSRRVQWLTNVVLRIANPK